MHMLSCVQALAHGSDTAMMFQWRKSRGGPEKFHGAVVDHVSHGGVFDSVTNENTRVFKDVQSVGAELKSMNERNDVYGTEVKPQVAIVYDVENRWALDAAAGPRNKDKDEKYVETLLTHYRPFWDKGVQVDIVWDTTTEVAHPNTVDIRCESREGRTLEMRGVSIDAEENIRIGSLTSFTHITNDPVIQRYINVLGEAVDMVGGPQIRNAGTIGGNTCNGVTSADSASTLHAWEAIVEITGKNGVRRVPIKDFYIKAGTVDLRVEDGVYIVEAPWLLKILQCTDMDDYESLQYFQRVLHSSGILAKLESMGIQQGDTVEIYDFEFDYMP